MGALVLFIYLPGATHTIPAAEPPKEGFADEDTYIVLGQGQSTSSAKTLSQAEATAKQAARLDAQVRFAELVRRDGRACGQASELTADTKNIMGATKSHKVLHVQCSVITDEPPAQACKVWISIRAKGLKKIMDGLKPGAAGQALGCGE